MTLEEFNALKIGDKVSNMQGHVATVAAGGEYGVQVQWSGNGPLFTLYRQGRIWVTMDVVPADEVTDKEKQTNDRRTEG